MYYHTITSAKAEWDDLLETLMVCLSGVYDPETSSHTSSGRRFTSEDEVAAC